MTIRINDGFGLSAKRRLSDDKIDLLARLHQTHAPFYEKRGVGTMKQAVRLIRREVLNKAFDLDEKNHVDFDKVSASDIMNRLASDKHFHETVKQAYLEK